MISALCTLSLVLAVYTGEPTDEAPALRELLDGVRVGEGVVEFNGEVAIDCHHPETPDVYLEMVVTGRNTREHESLVVTDTDASALHAALLAAGLTPGSPWEPGTPATGDGVEVWFAELDNGGEPETWTGAIDWVIDDDRETTLTDDEQWGGFVFAGSVLDERGYAADKAGTIVSLTVFGNETVSPVWTVSHDASVDPPAWIARNDRVPEKGTPVRVRLVAVGEEPDTTAPDAINPASEEPERVDIDEG